MSYTEKTINSTEIFSGKVITLRTEDVSLPDGNVGYREIIHHPGGVGIVALTDDNKILMVKQFRKAIEKEIYELPAGKLEKGEDPLVCGKRELEEETGYTAKEFVPLGFLYPSPGITDEITYVYLAWGLEKGNKNLDEDEFLDVCEMTIDEVYSQIMNNSINDAKTVIGFLKAMEYIKNN